MENEEIRWNTRRKRVEVWTAMGNDSLAPRKSQHAESSLRKSRRVSESVKQEAARAVDDGESSR